MYQHQACIITFPIFNLIKMKLDIMRGKKKILFYIILHVLIHLIYSTSILII